MLFSNNTLQRRHTEKNESPCLPSHACKWGLTLPLVDPRVIHTNQASIVVIAGCNQERATHILGIRENSLGSEIGILLQNILRDFGAFVKGRSAAKKNQTPPVRFPPHIPYPPGTTPANRRGRRIPTPHRKKNKKRTDRTKFVIASARIPIMMAP